MNWFIHLFCVPFCSFYGPGNNGIHLRLWTLSVSLPAEVLVPVTQSRSAYRSMCLANYGTSEAVYPCNVVEKIHEYFRSKMRQCL
jgi:hypothetical protein